MTEDNEVETEERAIYGIIACAISPVVVGVIIEGSTIDGGGAFSLLVAVCALVGLVAGIRAISRVRLPRARIYRKR